jgi:hypothetical protein
MSEDVLPAQSHTLNGQVLATAATNRSDGNGHTPPLTMGEAALAYRSLGLSVFPLKDKRTPLVKRCASRSSGGSTGTS